jgi:hypothetical protein
MINLSYVNFLKKSHKSFITEVYQKFSYKFLEILVNHYNNDDIFNNNDNFDKTNENINDNMKDSFNFTDNISNMFEKRNCNQTITKRKIIKFNTTQSNIQ